MDRRRFLLTTLAGTLAAPLAAEAQQVGKVYRVGLLGVTEPKTPDAVRILDAFLDVLREQGFVEGRNLVLERRYSEGREGRNVALAADLVQMKVDLIVAISSAGTHAAKQATATIPIVMANVANPEKQGLILSLARPGGNITGVSDQGAEVSGKIFQLLKEVLPQFSRIAILWNPDNQGSALGFKEGDVPAAHTLGLKVMSGEVRGLDDLERVLAMLTLDKPEVLYPHLAVWPHRARILDFAAKNRSPIVGLGRLWADAGGLLGYGPDLREQSRRVATYVATILKGARPGDLPVAQATKFELVLNLKTAKALGLTIPSSLLLRADHTVQ